MHHFEVTGEQETVTSLVIIRTALNSYFEWSRTTTKN